VSSSIPPGWYDDPAFAGSERWWNGSEWTESTRPATTGPADDEPPAVPAPPQSPLPQAVTQSFAPPRTPQQPGPPPQQVPYPPGPAPAVSSGRTGNRNRTIALSAVALLVVGGLVAALIVLLGGDDGDEDPTPPVASGAPSQSTKPGAETVGEATDDETGITVPLLKGWDTPVGESRPFHQYKDEVACAVVPTTSSEEPGGDDHCYLGEIDVGYYEGTAFDQVVGEVGAQMQDNDNYHETQRLKDESLRVDGGNAHLIRSEIREKAADPSGTTHTLTLQFVIIDSPYEQDGTQVFPIVIAAVDHDAKAPDQAVLDVVRDGIKVGAPHPSAS
jgi:hypothetical protein